MISERKSGTESPTLFFLPNLSLIFLFPVFLFSPQTFCENCRQNQGRVSVFCYCSLSLGRSDTTRQCRDFALTCYKKVDYER